MTPTQQLKTTQEQRQEWRAVYAYQVKHGEEGAGVDAGRILDLLDDLEAALARVAALEAAFNAYVKASMENRDLRR